MYTYSANVVIQLMLTNPREAFRGHSIFKVWFLISVLGKETRSNRRFLENRPDARTETQKEDMSGER